MNTFAEKRAALTEATKYKPGMEVDDKDIPVAYLILAWFACVGAIVHILALGYVIMRWML